MTCPDWTRLTAHRADPRLPEPAGWERAIAHLDGCRDCRRNALAADPSLVFRRLAVADGAVAGDVEAMREAVAAMRRASRLLPPPAGRRRPRLAAALDHLVATGGEVLGRGRTRAAAAALLAAGLLALAPSHPTPRTIVGAERSAGAGAGLATPALAAWAAEPAAAAAPVFEGLDRPRDARVYQLDGEGLVVVMIVDETLDV